MSSRKAHGSRASVPHPNVTSTCSATVDEKITLIANRKRHMNAALMDGDDASAGGGGDAADGDDDAAPEASAVTNILADAVSAYLNGTAEEAE